MHVKQCIVSMHGMTCYENIRLVDSFSSYLIFRILEYIMKETIVQFDKKLLIESFDGVSFT